MSKVKTNLTIDEELRGRALKILNQPPKKSLSQFVEEKLYELVDNAARGAAPRLTLAELRKLRQHWSALREPDLDLENIYQDRKRKKSRGLPM